MEKLFGSFEISDPQFSYKTSFEKILAKIAINKNLTLDDIKLLTDNEISQCSNEIFRCTKFHLINGQKLLDKEFDETIDEISIKELFELFEDLVNAGKQQQDKIHKLYSPKTAKIADQLLTTYGPMI